MSEEIPEPVPTEQLPRRQSRAERRAGAKAMRAMQGMPQRTSLKRGSKKPRKGGHPARVAARRRKEGPPDADELEVREIVRLVRLEATANGQERPLVGPLAAAAKHAAKVLCERVPGLEADEHRHGVENYLTERLGDVLDDFSVVDYRDWREQCQADALALREEQGRG